MVLSLCSHPALVLASLHAEFNSRYSQFSEKFVMMARVFLENPTAYALVSLQNPESVLGFDRTRKSHADLVMEIYCS